MFDYTNPVIDPTSELAEVLDTILRDLEQVVHCEHVRILLLPSVLDVRRGVSLDDEDDVLITVRDLGALGPLLGPVTPLSLDKYPLNRLVMTMQKPIIIADTQFSDLWVKGSPRDTIRAWIGAPLVVKGESIGVLTLHTSTPQAYTERDGIVVSAFASLAAEAIDKVRLLDQAQNRLHAMMALYDVSLDVIRQSQDPDRLLQALVRHATDLLRAETGAIYLMESDQHTLRLAITHGFADEYHGATLQLGEGVGGRVAASGEPLIVDDYRRWSGRADRFSRDPRFTAIIGVPLKWKDDVLGVLELCADSQVRTFDKQDRWLAELFANQVAIALSNVRLIEQSRRRLAELDALRSVSLQMTSTLDLDQVLDAICANVMSLTTAEDTHIFLYDEARDEFTHALAMWRSGARKPAVAQPRRGGLTDRVRQSGQPIVIDDAPQHELYSSPEALKWGIQSIAGFPLKRADRTLGVFTVAYTVPHQFGADELRVLSLLADQAAIAVENARLYEQARAERERLHLMSLDMEASNRDLAQRNRHLQALNELSAALATELSLDKILDAVTERVAGIIDVQVAGIMLPDADGVLRVRSCYGMPRDFFAALKIGPGSSSRHWQAYETGQPVIVNDPAAAMTSDAERRAALRGFESRNFLSVPLRSRNRTIGLMIVVNKVHDAEFTPADIDLLMTFTGQAAAAIENAELYEAAQYQLEVQSHLYSVITLLRSTLDVGEILDAVATILFDLFKPRICTISLIDHARGVISYPVVRGSDTPVPDVPLASLPQPLVDAGLAGHVSILDSLDNYADIQRIYDLPAHDGMVIVPIVGQKQTQGVITLVTTERPRYTAEQIESMQALANQAAIAIDNALAYEELETALTERERTQQALIRSESLAAVGQLVAGVAHELNNPLASVSSLVQSALETIGLPYVPTVDSSSTLPIIRPEQLKPVPLQDMIEISEDLAFSLKELRRAKGIVGSLLDLSRQSSSYTEEVSLTIVCQDALRILHNKLKDLPLTIVENYAEVLPMIRGNFANLGQVALNIIENAADSFNEQPGHIEVGTGCDTPRGVVYFYVRDDGPGIPPEALPNIFHPFFTTKRVGVGTGLGLYISYEIVKKHGGDIMVDTASSKGTTFRIEIPYMDGDGR